MTVSHFKITAAGLIALFTAGVGQVIALVPAWAPEKADIIQGGSFLIAGAFLLANSVHAVIASKINVPDIEQGVREIAAEEAGKINVGKLVDDALAGRPLPNIENAVRAELGKLLGQAASISTAIPVSHVTITPGPADTPVAAPAVEPVPPPVA